MSFTDPEKITINGVETSLPRVIVGKNESAYSSADGLLTLRASSQYGKRTRRMIRLDQSKITADPFIPAQNVKVSESIFLVFDLPPAGYTADEAKKAYAGFAALINASSEKLIVQLLGGES